MAAEPRNTGHHAAEPAHLPYVLDASHSVDDTTGRKKQERLEERVCHQVEHSRRVGAGAARQKHVSKLADGGVRENSLDVSLDQTDRRGEDSGERAHNSHD